MGAGGTKTETNFFNGLNQTQQILLWEFWRKIRINFPLHAENYCGRVKNHPEILRYYLAVADSNDSKSSSNIGEVYYYPFLRKHTIATLKLIDYFLRQPVHKERNIQSKLYYIALVHKNMSLSISMLETYMHEFVTYFLKDIPLMPSNLEYNWSTFLTNISTILYDKISELLMIEKFQMFAAVGSSITPEDLKLLVRPKSHKKIFSCFYTYNEDDEEVLQATPSQENYKNTLFWLEKSKFWKEKVLEWNLESNTYYICPAKHLKQKCGCKNAVTLSKEVLTNDENILPKDKLISSTPKNNLQQFYLDKNESNNSKINKRDTFQHYDSFSRSNVYFKYNNDFIDIEDFDDISNSKRDNFKEKTRQMTMGINKNYKKQSTGEYSDELNYDNILMTTEDNSNKNKKGGRNQQREEIHSYLQQIVPIENAKKKYFYDPTSFNLTSKTQLSSTVTPSAKILNETHCDPPVNKNLLENNHENKVVEVYEKQIATVSYDKFPDNFKTTEQNEKKFDKKT